MDEDTRRSLHYSVGMLPSGDQRLERKAARYGRGYDEWLFSALLDLVVGYGEALERIILAYVVVVGTFAAAYWAVTHYLETKLSALSWD